MNKQADESECGDICSSLGLETVNIIITFRLGKKKKNAVRPFKVILSDKCQRKCLLDDAIHIPRKLPTRVQKVVTNDLEQVQRQYRKERFELKKGPTNGCTNRTGKIEEKCSF